MATVRALVLTLLLAGCAAPAAAPATVAPSVEAPSADASAAAAAYKTAADTFNTAADAAKATLGSSSTLAAHQGQALVKQLAIFRARAADAAGATTTAEMAAREAAAVAAATPAADASAVLRDDLGAT